jgi:hypothetical protein
VATRIGLNLLTKLLLIAAGLSMSLDLPHAQQQPTRPPLFGENPSTFGDWIAGCDNTLVCRIVSLNSRDGSTGDLRMSIRRWPERQAMPEIMIDVGGPGADWPKGTYRFAIDDQPQGPAFDRSNAPIRLYRSDSMAGLQAILKASSIAIIDAQGRPTATASPNGLAAALRFVDRKMGLDGTTEASIDVGPKAWVPNPPPHPVIVRPPVSTRPPTLLPQAVLEDVQNSFGCPRRQPQSQSRVKHHRLDERTTLALVEPPCGGGPYNTNALAMIVSDDGVARRAELEAPLDQKTPHEVVSPYYDPKEQTLGSHHRGRGLGDCGLVQEWAWDGKVFRLFNQREMPSCAGSYDFVEIWRARLTER